MSRLLNFFRKLKLFQPRQAPSQASQSPTATSRLRDHTRFAEGDRVLLIGNSGAKITRPLCLDSKIQLRDGFLRHNDIIGQPLGRLKVKSSKEKIVTVDLPTLDEYISQSPRLVQPIYAPYAATIVDLLDIHVGPPTSSGQRIEILDAGTGHGSLALHLARTVAAANPPPPGLPFPKLRTNSGQAQETTSQDEQQADILGAWTEYRDARSAIVHSVERIAANSVHAEKIIRGFRQGLYWPHIDFYTAGVEDWVQQQLAGRPPFLSSATLDLPDVHEVIGTVFEALLPGGKLAVFAPSITQIAECQKVIEQKRLPVRLAKAVELGEGISTGRLWDLRFVTPRAREKAQAQPIDSESETEAVEDIGNTSSAEEPAQDQTDRSGTGKVLVCRPKVGARVVGGGFVGLFQKTSSVSSAPDKPRDEQVGNTGSSV